MQQIVPQSTKEITLTCLSFVITGVYGGTKVCREIEIGAVINGSIRMYYLCFTYTPVSTLVLFLDSEQEHEQSAYVLCEFSFYRLPLCYS